MAISIFPDVIQSGADVDARDGSYSTPLHRASSIGLNGTAARVLLELGADANAYDGYHRKPLDLVSDSELPDVELIRLLTYLKKTQM